MFNADALAWSIRAAPPAAAAPRNSRRRIAFIYNSFFRRYAEEDTFERKPWDDKFEQFTGHCRPDAVAIRFPNTLSLIGLASFFALIRLRFEVFDFLKFSGGFLLAAKLLIASRQQITGLRIVRLLAGGLLQDSNGF